MANHKIIASGTTRVIGVGIKTAYIPAPKPSGLSALPGRREDADWIHAPSGSVIRLLWQMTPPADQYEVEVLRLRNSDGGVESRTASVTVTAPFVNWNALKAGLYLVRVRAAESAWVNSKDPVIDGDGASRGWLLHVYLAPVSGGGVR